MKNLTIELEDADGNTAVFEGVGGINIDVTGHIVMQDPDGHALDDDEIEDDRWIKVTVTDVKN